MNYSFISLTSKGGTSAQHRHVKYLNLYQVCSAASYLARLVAFSCFEFSGRIFKTLCLSDFIGSFPLIINPAAVLQIREISSPLVLSLKKVVFLSSFCLSGKLCLNYSETFWIHNNQDFVNHLCEGQHSLWHLGEFVPGQLVKTPKVGKKNQVTATSPAFFD